MRKTKVKRQFLIGGLVVVLALGYLGYRGFAGSASYYYKIDEFVAQNISTADKNVRVSGQVVPGSIEQQGLNMKFNIAGTQETLPVVYQGAVPDSFKAGGEVIVEGKLNSEGVFVAQTLLTKCPSKYKPA
jgi:cytochrome c-type biogenesis protein CcmE